MNEMMIQNKLYWEYHGSSKLSIPNYTPLGWWECDFFHVTKAGYAVEHEIKISRSDYFADSKKSNRVKGYGGNAIYENKHTLLTLGDQRGPKQFYFVVPQDLIAIDEVPEFAGLKYVSMYRRGDAEQLSVSIIKKAPILHKDKVNQEVVNHAKSVFYYRYWNLRQKKGGIA